MDDALIDQVNAVFSGPDRPWTPPSTDDAMPFGKHRGSSYRAAANRDRSYMRWAARTIGGLKGSLCAEAVADQLLGPSDPEAPAWMLVPCDGANP